MNFKKILTCVSFGLVGATAFSLALAGQKISEARALDETPIAHTAKIEAPYDFSGETLIEDNVLMVKATSATKTRTGESFAISFSTGGNGYQDSTKTFIVTVDDPEYDTFYSEYQNMTLEEKEALAEKIASGEEETRVFSSKIFNLLYSNSYKDIIVPNSLSRSNKVYSFAISQIADGALTEEDVNKGIKSVTIPKTILSLSDLAFPENLPEEFVFNVEFAEDELPIDWDSDWNHGATVNYGYDYESLASKRRLPNMSGASVPYGSPDSNFIIGYYPTDGSKQYPLVLSYNLVGSNEIKFFEFSKSKTSSIGSAFDSVGANLYGFTNDLYADISIDLPIGQEIDFESLKIHNIFPAVKDAEKNQWVPKTDEMYFAIPRKSFKQVLDVENFISYRFDSISTFGGYTSVDMIVDQQGTDIYSAMQSGFYRQYEDDIELGKAYIRYRITSLSSCQFKVTYHHDGKDVEKLLSISSDKKADVYTPLNNISLTKSKNNVVSFVLNDSKVGDGFSASAIREFSFISFYVTLDLYNKVSGKIARSDLVVRFGYFTAMPHTQSARVFNINTMLIIMSVSYAVVYAAAAAGLFFYSKNKFKNDEFRRLKPKKFILKAVLGLLGSLVVILFVTFIVLRATAFNNAMVVYNPMDAYIIVSAVASVLIIGYFIKYLVGVIKANNERRKALRLRLNEDVDDDGTK